MTTDDNRSRASYSYPDSDDSITAIFVGGHDSPYARYWERSERRVLEIMREHIRTYTRDRLERASNGDIALLDAGCGEGRLLPTFADLFSRIVALEPDARRLERARAAQAQASFAAEVVFACATVQELKTPERFDVVLSSHVLQHLHTENVAHFIDALVARLRPGGLLLLTTCHSTRDVPFYEACHIDAGVIRRRELSEQEFNACVYANDGSLPSHYLARSSLVAALEARELSVVEFGVFHLSEPDLCEWGDGLPDWDEVDERVNQEEKTQALVGEDMFIVARLDQEPKTLPVH